MNTHPETLSASADLGFAVKRLMELRVTSLPVVDDEGRYVGMFGLGDLLSVVVPRVAIAGDLIPNLRFIGDDLSVLRARYQETKSRRVGDMADRNAATLAPDAPQIEAFRLFCRSHGPVPVVEPVSRKLAGVITCWSSIASISGLSGGAG
jgi:CBS domain-containing protein